MNSSTPHRLIKNADMHQTLAAMKEEAHKGKKDLSVRSLVEQLCKDLPSGDYASEVLACYYWVCRNIRYMRDIDKVEFLKSPHRLLATGTGDCDDMSTLLASMLMACGNQCRFVIVGFRPSSPPNFTHVFVQARTPQGWLTLDPVSNKITKEMHTNTAVLQGYAV
jgi:transglutaminase-like putative cysteine protease